MTLGSHPPSVSLICCFVNVNATEKNQEYFIMNVILFLDFCFIFTPHARVRVRVYVCVRGKALLIGLQIYIFNFIKKYFFLCLVLSTINRLT